MRRWIVALCIALLLFGVTLVAAATIRDPDTWHVAAASEGETLRYAYTVDGLDAAIEDITVTWGAREPVYDRWAVERNAVAFHVSGPAGYTAYLAPNGSLVRLTVDVGGSETDGTSAFGLSYTFFDFPPLCMWRAGLEGWTIDLDDVELGYCHLLPADVEPTGFEGLGNASWSFAGVDEIDGRSAARFDAAWGDIRFRVWFGHDVPGPLRYEVAVEDMTYVSFLVGHAEGTPYAALPATTGASLDAMRVRPPSPLTLHDDVGGVLPLEVADRLARADADTDAWLAAHPEAWLASAESGHQVTSDTESWTWDLVYADGDEAWVVDASRSKRYLAAESTPVVGPILFGHDTLFIESEGASGQARSGWSAMPRPEPTLAASDLFFLADKYGEPEPQHWGFSYGCFCDKPVETLWAGRADTRFDGGPAAVVMGIQFALERTGPQIVDGEVQPTLALSTSYQQSTVVSGVDVEFDGYSLQSAGILWSAPPPVTTLSVGLFAAVIGILVWLLPGLPLFSRVQKHQLLDHPMRAAIVSAVETEPGIHLHGLRRHLDTSRRTVEHHVGKLLADGLIVETKSAGYRCFSLPDAGRELGAALPVLRTDGARRVLQAIQEEQTGRDVARRIGMAPSTVSYHARKLTANGLVERAGRQGTLRLTPLGRRALATRPQR